jgi:hypothetical protein
MNRRCVAGKYAGKVGVFVTGRLFLKEESCFLFRGKKGIISSI